MGLRGLIVVLILAALGTPLCSAAAAEGRLVVGTRVVPPFVVRQDDGTLAGIGIDLWREIATDLGLEYELRETGLAGMLDGLRDGTMDVAVAALIVTAEREGHMDFSHPFYTSGLGIAVPHHAVGEWVMLRAVWWAPCGAPPAPSTVPSTACACGSTTAQAQRCKTWCRAGWRPVLYDAPVMRYLSNGPLAGQVDVLPRTFLHQDYAIGLRAGSSLRESINRALLKHTAEPAWRETLYATWATDALCPLCSLWCKSSELEPVDGEQRSRPHGRSYKL